MKIELQRVIDLYLEPKVAGIILGGEKSSGIYSKISDRAEREISAFKTDYGLAPYVFMQVNGEMLIRKGAVLGQEPGAKQLQLGNIGNMVKRDFDIGVITGIGGRFESESAD